MRSSSDLPQKSEIRTLKLGAHVQLASKMNFTTFEIRDSATSITNTTIPENRQDGTHTQEQWDGMQREWDTDRRRVVSFATRGRAAALSSLPTPVRNHHHHHREIARLGDAH